MTGLPRIVQGTILRLRCDSCGSIFPHFLFSGEGDADTVGLCSASSCRENEVAITEVDSYEWRNFDHAGRASIEKKLATQFARCDFRVVRLLRVGREEHSAVGLGFSDFQKAYKPPVLIYACVCCATGESRAIQEITIGDFNLAGGRIFLAGRLAL